MGQTQARAFDIVVFGATGFTGRLVLDYLAGCKEAPGLRWALAGRSRDKLEEQRARLGASSPNPPRLIVADVGDPDSVRQMASQTRVLATTVGPYGRYGEPVLQACAELGTDYVDLTGEPVFVREMIERYDDIARERGAKIVNACGFDSIPHDLGAYFTVQRLRDKLDPAQAQSAPVQVEGIVRAKGSVSGGTWHSALEIMSQVIGDRAARRSWLQSLQQGTRVVRLESGRPRRRPELGLWTVPMPTIDPEVVARSAAVMPEYGVDFRYTHSIGLRNGAQVAGLLVGAGSLFTLAQLPPARALLQRFKRPGEGPSAEQRARNFFRVHFIGEAAGQEVRCEVRGKDPGYGDTAKMLAESALCLAFDRSGLAERYGLLTPAAAMGNALIERLHAAGMTFSEV